LKGVFVPKMSGVNSGQNVNIGSFVGHMVFRFLFGLPYAAIINQKPTFRRPALSQSSGRTLMTTILA